MVTMIEREHGLIINGNEELGVDLVGIYTGSCYLKYSLPNFVDIYDEYRIEVLQKNIDVNVPFLEQQLSYLRKNVDLSKVEQAPVEDLDMKSEVEFFHYLMNRNLAFKHDKLIINCPIVEVW